MGPEVQPAGGLTGYMTMMGAMGTNINQNARLGALLKDQPYIQAQQQAQTQGQNIQNQQMPLTMQNATYGSPFQQQQFQQQANQLSVQNQMAQQNAARQMALEQETMKRNTEFMRHNMKTEDTAAKSEQIKAAAQDPFNLSGLNPGVQTGAPETGAQPQQPGQPGQDQAQAPTVGNIRQAMLDPNLNGDDFLKQLPIPMASMVKAMVEGRQAPPSSFALKSPQWIAMLQAANKYDPGFDQTIWTARAQTRKSFSPGGKDMANLNSMNTLIGHLGTLKGAAESLNNGDIQGINSFVNGVQNYLGDPRVNNFNTAKNAVGNELMRTFIGVGAGSEKEIRSWKDSFDTSNSPAQLKGAIQTAADLLESRLQTQNHAYEQGMGKQADVLQMVYPKSRAALDAISGKSPQEASAAPSKAEQYPTATAPNGRKVIFKDGKWQTMP
jgi:hypothetical protein